MSIILLDSPRSAYDRLLDRIAHNHLLAQEEQARRSQETLRRLAFASAMDELRQSAGLPLGHSWKVHTVYRLDLPGDQQKGGD